MPSMGMGRWRTVTTDRPLACDTSLLRQSCITNSFGHDSHIVNGGHVRIMQRLSHHSGNPFVDASRTGRRCARCARSSSTWGIHCRVGGAPCRLMLPGACVCGVEREVGACKRCAAAQISPTRQQRTRCPGPTGSSAGAGRARQRSCAWMQRVWKWQPVGGAAAVMAARGSGTGAEPISARVYGCRGCANKSCASALSTTLRGIDAIDASLLKR